MVKIGDSVRFLSDVGGGIVRGFKGKNVVLVEDEDGFQMPVPVDEVVAILTDDHNFERASSVSSKENPAPQPEPSDDLSERPVVYRPKPIERKDGERLNLYLDFLPVDGKTISTTTFETYLVNDCNYFAAFSYLSREDAEWRVRAHGVAEPNTKVFLEEIDHAQLNDIEHVAVQAVFWKQDKLFGMKPPVSVQLRLDITKFCKPHTFRESLFFDEPVQELPLVVDDNPVRPVRVSAEELGRAMQEKRRQDMPRPVRERQEKRPNLHEIMEVDLHAHALLETTAGMQPGDIKEYQLKVFRETLDAHLKEKGRRIVFIHGKGEGALRAAILAELKHRYKTCTSQDASFQQYGFGATMITIH